MQNQPTHSSDDAPLVSFIITDYNLPAKMLVQCIDSVISLTLRHYEREIIVVDDGSDASVINELLEYRDSIIYLRQPNSGLSEARNLGIRASRGRYIQFIDGDDYLIRPAYEHCLDIIRFRDNICLVLFELTRKETENKGYKDETFNSGSEYMHNRNLRASACGYIFERKTLGELRFTKVKFNEDEIFTPQLFLRTEQMVSTNAQAYFYRRRELSKTRANDPRNVISRLNDTEHILLYLNSIQTEMPAYDGLALKRRVSQLTMDYIYNIITETHNEQQLERRIARLRKAGLFPLPDREYTRKYQWFRLLTANKTGRKILLRALPHIKRR